MGEGREGEREKGREGKTEEGRREKMRKNPSQLKSL